MSSTRAVRTAGTGSLSEPSTTTTGRLRVAFGKRIAVLVNNHNVEDVVKKACQQFRLSAVDSEQYILLGSFDGDELELTNDVLKTWPEKEVSQLLEIPDSEWPQAGGKERQTEISALCECKCHQFKFENGQDRIGTIPKLTPALSVPPPSITVRGIATHAYGFILSEECLRHWTKVYCDKRYGPEVLSSMTAKEAEQEIDSVFATTSDRTPTMVYKQFPRIPGHPGLRRRLILMSGANGRWLLVLKDKSSQTMLTTRIAPEDVEGARKLLDLGEQKPMWYRIPA